MLLVFPSIMNNVKGTKGEISKAGKNLLLNSASLYIDSNQNSYPLEEGNSYCITIKELLDSKKLESVNLIQGLKETDRIEVTVKNNKYEYQLNNTCNRSLKDHIESETNHIIMNTKINGETVNKVIGKKTEKLTMTNYVWHMGQLWQVIETNDTTHTIKMVTAHSLTAIAYGPTNDWNTSWVKKWLNEVFLASLEGTEQITNTSFCTATIDIPPESYSKMNTCPTRINEQVGLITYEDYIYAYDGKTIHNGGSFLDEDELSWTITSTSTNNQYMWHTDYSSTSVITLDVSSDGENYANTNSTGNGIRPVISIMDTAMIKSGMGTKKDPYILSNEKKANPGSHLMNAKVGDYVYMDESKNPYHFTSEKIARDLTYEAEKHKVRYRIVKKNNDGSVKLERADVLRNLPDTISIKNGASIPYYYKEINNECYYNTSEEKWYTAGCRDHNKFEINNVTSSYDYHNATSIGDFLNSASNSFYNWFSDTAKSMIKKETYHRYTGGVGKDYSNLNDNPTVSYPNLTDDGDISAYVVLPTWGEMYTGNDLNVSYWYINRGQKAYTGVTRVTNNSRTATSNICDSVLSVRPVITLKPSVTIQSGSGTMTNPYTISP